MKKFVLFLVCMLVLCGCQKNQKTVLNDLTQKIEKTNSYYMSGTLEIYRNEDKYTYSVKSSYQKDDLYKVDLINQNNDHEQIILKNNDGVYVITPSLNKNFKFQSEWPNNNSQIYLLQPIINDLNSDKNMSVESSNGEYVITSKVNYSSEKDFDSQKVYVNSEGNIYKVEVLDSENNVKMCLNIIELDFNPNFSEDYFDASKYQNSIETTESSTSKIDDVVYPMYVPIDTELTSHDVVSTSDGERVILTFGGESSFILVEETYKDESSTNLIYGDPYLILDTVGSITDNTVSWISNGIEYSVISNTMDTNELLTVAQSITVKTVGK